jgi:acyl-CoA dehydrogenase
MIQALYKTGKVPVPRVITLCQNKEILGSDFYVMDFVAGRIFHSPTFEGLSPQDRRAW